MTARGLKVAPVRRRLAAGAIDVVVVGVPLMAVIGGGSWLYAKYVDDGPERLIRLQRSRGGRLVSSGLNAGVGIAGRNWRSPGSRALGLRRVEVRTGGPVLLRTAIVQHVVTQAWTQSTRLLAKPYMKRNQEHLKALEAEMKEIRRRHAGDTETERRAVKDLYEQRPVNAALPCLPYLISAAFLSLQVVWSPLNQTLPERLAGIVVVED